jgi:ElaB/YqjD/DUF883 family membrane-anchored ribosome-binding protein
VQFKLDLNAYAMLEALLKQHGLRSRDELIAHPARTNALLKDANRDLGDRACGTGWAC